MENVSEYKREHLYPILEQTIIPEFKESYHTKLKASAPNFNLNRINNEQGPANFVGEFLLEKKKLDEKLIHYKKIKIDGLQLIHQLKLLVFL